MFQFHASARGSGAGCLLVIAAFVAGFWFYGWPGLFLAFTLTVFWGLLQFSRTLRLMRRMAQHPMGTVPNAVMFHAQLRPGQSVQEVMGSAGSLGRRLPQPEPGFDDSLEWQDSAHDRVIAHFRAGRLAQHQLWRAPRPDDMPNGPEAEPPVLPLK